MKLQRNYIAETIRDIRANIHCAKMECEEFENIDTNDIKMAGIQTAFEHIASYLDDISNGIEDIEIAAGDISSTLDDVIKMIG